MNKVKRFLKATFILIIIVFISIMLFKKTNNKNNVYESFSKPLEKKGCLGLNYHRIRKNTFATRLIEKLTISDELQFFSIYDDEFEYHIKTLVENDANFLSMEEFKKYSKSGKFPKRSVWISFDDMDISVYKNAFPILKKYNVPFTSYIIAGQVGTDNYNNLKIASWEQIQEMVDSGLMTVGSHSYDMHRLEDDKPIFFKPNNKEAYLQDLILSKNSLEKNLNGVEVLDYAYPYGNGKEELVDDIKKAGFQSAALLYPDIIEEDDSLFWINRLVVDHTVFTSVVEPWLE